MSTAVLQSPIFTDETKAREWLEAELWPEGPVCPHCGVIAKATKVQGKSHRPGLYMCNACRQQFTVTVGTVFERSKIPLTKWLMALFLLTSSKKGISAHQMHRMLGVSYKSTWFMMHRLREAMADGTFPGPLGGEGQTIEADETYIGLKAGAKRGRGFNHKNVVMTLVERDGRARSVKIDKVTTANCRAVLVQNADRKSRLVTDEGHWYIRVGREYTKHETVNHHPDEYVRGDVYTNTVEGYFSIFKRGMKGVYQHCGESHLHRYLAEFDFRYSHRAKLGYSDEERARTLAKGIVGKRLTYRRTDNGAHI